MQRLGPRMKLWHINDRGTRITGSAITPILKNDSMELGTGNMGLATTLGVISMVPSIFFAAFGAKYVGKNGSKRCV